ncbi:unnamed protein product [Caenorhabditis sp. 36 PRJEB53466]|nr:unnamed protein product [Caenorhabditis sp. 36 PRJEB53466]
MALGDDDILSVPFKYFVLFIGGLPSSALLICVLLSLFLHFEQSTATHCEVSNYLPSISAAVSTYSPEKYIWRILIGLHIGPRFAVSIACRNYLTSSPLRPLTGSKQFRTLCNVACLLNLLENFFLLALTSISSSEDHTLHAKCFGGFAICSIVYMVLSTWLFSESGRRRATNLGEKSYEYKILGASIFIVCFVMGGYLYWRHNTYCEPGIYTLFALVEYSAVLSNIFFHCTLYYDFHGKNIALTSSFGGGGYSLLPTQIEKDTVMTIRSTEGAHKMQKMEDKAPIAPPSMMSSDQQPKRSIEYYMPKCIRPETRSQYVLRGLSSLVFCSVSVCYTFQAYCISRRISDKCIAVLTCALAFIWLMIGMHRSLKYLHLYAKLSLSMMCASIGLLLVLPIHVASAEVMKSGDYKRGMFFGLRTSVFVFCFATAFWYLAWICFATDRILAKVEQLLKRKSDISAC